MKITTAAALIGVSCALFAGPAFAQNSATKAGDYAKETATPEAPVIAESTPQGTLPKLTVSTPKSPSQNAGGDTGYIFPEGFKPTPGLKKVPSSLPVPSPKYTPSAGPATSPTLGIDCPYGTTAQANGTCLITGEYKN